jgi:hypothetical protein
MSIVDLDLNIQNYGIPDLVKFFRLKKKYTISDVELQETTIREQLLNSGHINKRIKRDLMAFLSMAKQLLIYTIQNNEDLAPTSIPKINYPLDPVNVPNANLPPFSRTDDLVQRPETQFVHSNQSQYFPGYINPLNTRVTTKCLTIDTRFRDNLYTTQSSDFMIQLPFKLTKIVSMQLTSIELPIAFYGISSKYGNNHFLISVKAHDLSSNEIIQEDLSVMLSDGNYNADDLISAINTQLQTEGVPFSLIEFAIDLSKTGSGTGKTLVTSNSSSDYIIESITLDFSKNENNCPDTINNITHKLGWNLGFIRPFYSENTQYVSDTMIEPAAIRYVYLEIDDYNNSMNNMFYSAFEKSALNSNVLARISINVEHFHILMENNLNIVSEPRHYFGPVDIQRLRVRLLDEHGRVLAMNQSNYSFCLNFKTLYDL